MIYSVVIPPYNDVATLPMLRELVSAVMRDLGQAYEVVYIHYGSQDDTLGVPLDIHRQDPTHVHAIRLMRNFGQHPAVTAGFDHAAGEIVITLDSDLQNPPGGIPQLLAKLDEGYDVVTGWRQVRHDPWMRKLPSRFINWIICGLTAGVVWYSMRCRAGRTISFVSW